MLYKIEREADRLKIKKGRKQWKRGRRQKSTESVFGKLVELKIRA